MIRPRPPKVATGARLTADLVNGIINRTEYAADLLRQHKLIAGTEMYIEPHYDGTRVSYLQPVGGGTTPAQPVSPAYRVVGTATVGGLTKGFLYNGSTFTDIIYPGGSETVAYDVDGSNVVGSTSVSGITKGFLYNGSTFTDIIYPGADFYTIPFGISGSNISGEAAKSRPSAFTRGFLYNGSSFTDIMYPGQSITQARKIDGSNIVGTSNGIPFLYNGSTFIQITNPYGFQPFGIDGPNIVGSATSGGVNRGMLYNGSTFTDIIYPGASSTNVFGVSGSNIVGAATVGGITKGFLYNGSTFTDIIYPGASGTSAYGIG